MHLISAWEHFFQILLAINVDHSGKKSYKWQFFIIQTPAGNSYNSILFYMSFPLIIIGFILSCVADYTPTHDERINGKKVTIKLILFPPT